MMRVLHVYSGNLFGGIETVLVTLARHRDTVVGIHQDVALCHDGRLRTELDATGIAVHRLPAARASRPHVIARARRALANLIAREAYDAVICHAPWSQALFGPVVRRVGVPLVFWAHDVASGRHWTERLAKRVAPDLAVCNSEYTARALPVLYPGVTSVVIRCPIDCAPIDAGEDVRRRVRADLHTSERTTVIVHASRMDPIKGHEILLRALAAIDPGCDWTCWIAGGAQRPEDATYRDALHDLASTLRIDERVRFLGERRDVPRLLAAADIHCQPNLRPDAFGIAFIEAMAAGLPVVTTNIGGGAEIVDASCGLLVEVGDVAGVSRALERLVSDAPLRAQLGTAARQRAQMLCDPESQLRLLGDALRSLATSALHA
jgi:glycosyltransferase involved in cell wall biosynthesis